MKTAILTAAIIAGFGLTALPALADQGDKRPDFATLDLDDNGQLTLDELQAGNAARFDDLDTNGDGRLSVEELAATGADKAAERAAKVLEHLDADEDGVVSAAEMAPPAARTERMLDRADKDDDGTISEEEFDAVKERGGRRGGDRGGRGGRGHGGRG